MLELSSTFRIHRYPAALIDRVMLANGRSVLVRPVLPQDGALHQRFVRELSPVSRYRRFHSAVSELPEATLDYLTQVDYASHLALLAETFDERDGEVQVAEARYVRRTDADEAHVADFALAVADRWQGLGLGRRMLKALVDSARRAGVRRLEGSVLADNEPMCVLLRRNGWKLRIDPDDGRLLVARLELAPVPAPALAPALLPALAPALEAAPC
ncbi:MAG: GNAT family N-acetyltransferase [Burkholderiaceae bacterium]|nr:GNAT family N-acetyltransferase [Burkholderiaceae bacterium]